MLENRGLAPVGADIQIAVDAAHQDDTVGSKQRHHVLFTECQRIHALAEEFKLERAGHDAVKAAVGVVEPAADGNAPSAVLKTRLERLTDIKAVFAGRVPL